MLYLGATWWAGRALYGPERGALILPLAAGFLLLTEYSPQGIGLGSIYYTGLLPAFFALILLSVFAGSLFQALQTPSWRWSLAAGLLLGLVVLSHVLTAIFAVLFTAAVVLGSGKRERWIVAATVLLITAFISSWWWLRLLSELPFSSGATLYAELFGDPLAWFFPIGENITGTGPRGSLAASVHGIFMEQYLPPRPWWAIGIAALSVVGIVQLLRRSELTLPLFFLTMLLLMNGRLLSALSPVPLHAYRWAGALWMVHLLLAVAGIEAVARSARLRPWILPALTILMGTQILIGDQFGIGRWNGGAITELTTDVRALPGYPAAQQILRAIREHPSTGRIAVESVDATMRLLGSPHYFLGAIPRETGRAVMPGLFVESSTTAPYITALLHRGESQLLWGDAEVAQSEVIRQLSPEEVVRRLRFFGVSQLLTSAAPLRKLLLDCSQCGVTMLAEASPFALLSIGAEAPLVSRLLYRPFFFVEHDGIRYREFSKWYFNSAELLDFHILYRPGGIETLTDQERSLLGGVIVSTTPDSRITEDQLRRWGELGHVILLNHGAQFPRPKGMPVGVVQRMADDEGARLIEEQLRNYRPGTRFLQPVSPSQAGKGCTRIDAPGPILFRSGYFSGVTANGGTLRPFAATPGFVGFLAPVIEEICW
jgi:hypothetical protein